MNGKEWRGLPSKLNAAVRVPTIPATVARTPWSVPTPNGVKHSADVPEAHETVLQLDRPSRTDAVMSRVENEIPDTVTLHDEVVTTFVSIAKLTTGAGITTARTVSAALASRRQQGASRRTVEAERRRPRARHAGHCRHHR